MQRVNSLAGSVSKRASPPKPAAKGMGLNKAEEIVDLDEEPAKVPLSAWVCVLHRQVCVGCNTCLTRNLSPCSSFASFKSAPVLDSHAMG
jgi:hypothetical protein